MDINPIPAFQVHVGTLRAKSRGYVKIKSNNPLEHPEIQPNLCQVSSDLDDMVKCVDLT